jgi:hypothetical protein
MILIAQQIINEVEYFIEGIKTEIVNYDLQGLSNNNLPSSVSVNDTHPLAMLYGAMVNSTTNDYTSMLPAIGVEHVDRKENNRKLLGDGKKLFEVTQEYIDSLKELTLKERLAQAIIVSDNTIDKIQEAYNNKHPEEEGATQLKLKARQYTVINRDFLMISVWTLSPEVTRIIRRITESIIRKLEKQLTAIGVKDMNLSIKPNLYSYDFDQTLFGAEMSIDFLQASVETEIDETIQHVTTVNETTDKDYDPKVTGVPIS